VFVSLVVTVSSLAATGVGVVSSLPRTRTVHSFLSWSTVNSPWYLPRSNTTPPFGPLPWAWSSCLPAAFGASPFLAPVFAGSPHPARAATSRPTPSVFAYFISFILSQERNRLRGIPPTYELDRSSSSSEPSRRASRSASLPLKRQNSPGWRRNSHSVEVTSP